MSLKDLSADARPREKLLARGPAALQDAELLALLLRTGRKGQAVLQLSQSLLDAFVGLGGLLRAQPADPKKGKGLGPAKLAEVAAVLEIARRSVAQALTAAPVFGAPDKVNQFLALHLGGLAHEEFAVVLLDSQHRLRQMKTLFRGTLGHTSVFSREVVKEALALNAGAVILAHNHPRGTAEPWRADESLTPTLKSARQLVGVRVLDHLVVGRGVGVSLAERGLL